MWYLHAARDVVRGGPCSDGGDADRDRGGARAGQALRAVPGRAALGARMGGAGVLPRRRRVGQAAVLHRSAAAERDREPAPGTRAHRQHRGRARPVEAHERVQRPVAAGDRPRGHRHPDGGRARAGPHRAEVAPRPGPRGVRPPRLAVERTVRQPDRGAASRIGRLAGLGARALHHGRAFFARGARGVRAAVRRRAALPVGTAHPLVREGPDGFERSGGRARGARAGRAVQVRLSARRRVRGDRGRHHAPGDDAGRYRRGRAPGRPALQGNGRKAGQAPAAGPDLPDHRRRRAGRSEVRHRSGEGHSGA